jgi:hypothetical protein
MHRNANFIYIRKYNRINRRFRYINIVKDIEFK